MCKTDSLETLNHWLPHRKFLKPVHNKSQIIPGNITGACVWV
jgi:hypothetical protein